MRLLARAALAAVLVAILVWRPANAADNLRTSAQSINTAVSNAALSFNLFANETVMAVNVTGLTAAGATLTIEGSSDARALGDSAKVWFATVAMPFTCPSPATFTTLSADEAFKLDVTGLTNIRFRVSSTGSGNAVIGLNAVPGATMGTCGGTGGGGGGGGPATIADGADVTQGSIGDSPWSGTGNGTLDAIMKAIYNAVISPPTPGSTTGGLTFVTKTGINGTPQQIGTTGAHQVYVEHCDNGTSALNTANTYLQYYDTATTPTFGTSVTFADPIAGSLTDGFALSLVGGQIANGIWITAATAPSGNTAPTNSLTCLFGYK